MTKVELFLRQEGGEELWDVFMYNYEEYPLSELSTGEWQNIEFDDYIAERGNNQNAINEAFSWEDTEEGDDFWWRLFDKYTKYFKNIKPKLISL